MQDLRDLHPIEIEFPDVDPYRKRNTGIDWLTSFDSGVSGPHVMIAALVHGNEPCGAVALDWLFKQETRPTRGRLSLAFMNVAAYKCFDRAAPMASRYLDEDFNRLWSAEILDGERTSRELERARQVRPLVDTVDFLLDLHSMQHRVLPLVLAGSLPKGRAFAEMTGMPSMVVSDRGHEAGPRLRDYNGFGEADSPKNALLVECGQHWEEAASPTAIEASIRFLRATGVVPADFGADFLARRPALVPQLFIEVTHAVTVHTDNFRFLHEYRGLEIVPEAETIIAYDDGEPVVTPYDHAVIVMPSCRLEKGTTAVRFGRYIRR